MKNLIRSPFTSEVDGLLVFVGRGVDLIRPRVLSSADHSFFFNANRDSAKSFSFAMNSFDPYPASKEKARYGIRPSNVVHDVLALELPTFNVIAPPSNRKKTMTPLIPPDAGRK